MKIHSIKGGVPAQGKPVEEKALPTETIDTIDSMYGVDNLDADMQRKLRILRKADPELYRKITNLD